MNTATTVVRARRKGVRGYVNVGRPSIFGNPFVVGGDSRNAQEAHDCFRAYFEHCMKWEPGFRAAVLKLRGKVIGCSCRFDERHPIYPRRCHAYVIADYLNNLPPDEPDEKAEAADA